MTKERFGRDYYQRFYRNARSSVTSQAEMTARANLIAAYVKHIDCPVGSVLDAGCGLGLMRTALLRALPGATYVGLEYSEYLCQKYGWMAASQIIGRASLLIWSFATTYCNILMTNLQRKRCGISRIFAAA